MSILKNRFLRYFFDGLLLLFPFLITYAVLIIAIDKSKDVIMPLLRAIAPRLNNIDSRWDHLFGALCIGIGLIWLLGYLGSSFAIRMIIGGLDALVLRIPFVSTVYSYAKEYSKGFMQKLDQPVRVTINKELGIERLGFITEKELHRIGISDKVAVYLPHASLTFTGEVHIVPKELITPINASRSVILKFIVSGGISGLETATEHII